MEKRKRITKFIANFTVFYTVISFLYVWYLSTTDFYLERPTVYEKLTNVSFYQLILTLPVWVVLGVSIIIVVVGGGIIISWVLVYFRNLIYDILNGEWK